MKRIFNPAFAGINAVRHLAWYLGYQASGTRQ
jgi:hypothetical protein